MRLMEPIFISAEALYIGMAAGADMAAVSMHKSGGSLTQDSLLLLNKIMNAEKVPDHQSDSDHKRFLSFCCQSGYLPKKSGTPGEESFEKSCRDAQYAREEINEIGGFIMHIVWI